MKKLLGIVVLGLLWCNVSNGEGFNSKKLEEECLESGKTKSVCKKEVYGWDLNDYIKDGYKIRSEELVNGSNWLITIFVLKKIGPTGLSGVVTCKVDHFSNKTICREP